MLGINEYDNKYRNIDKNICDIYDVKNHLTEAILDALGNQDEVLVTSENEKIQASME